MKDSRNRIMKNIEKYLNERSPGAQAPIPRSRPKPTIQTDRLKGSFSLKEKELVIHALQFAIDSQQKMGAITPKMAKELEKIMKRF